ncbi:MAG: N-acetylneuraminate synthase family protein [Nitrososphaeraceae archaeon]
MISIGHRCLKKYESIYIIAEIGSNHDSNLSRAKNLIQLAKECGADAAKFQCFRAEDLISTEGFKKKMSFQSKWKKSVWDTYLSAEMPREWHYELADFSKSQGIDFFTSPWDPNAVELLAEIKSPAIKIGSGDIDNYELLNLAAMTGKPILLGTGASTLSDIEAAVNKIKAAGNDQIILMHSVVNYPSDINQANIRALMAMETSFGLPVGYSDHSVGDLVVISSVSLGAVAVEKHFTDDNTRSGPDHLHSMTPPEFSEMISKVRTLQKALGNGVKSVVNDEVETRILQRRSIFASKPIKKGERITSHNTCLLRPAIGIPASYLGLVIGKKASSTIDQGQPFQWSDI